MSSFLVYVKKKTLTNWFNWIDWTFMFISSIGTISMSITTCTYWNATDNVANKLIFFTNYFERTTNLLITNFFFKIWKKLNENKKKLTFRTIFFIFTIWTIWGTVTFLNITNKYRCTATTYFVVSTTQVVYNFVMEFSLKFLFLSFFF